MDVNGANRVIAAETGTDLASKIAAAYVNPGWRPRDWAARLRQLAQRCEELHPQHAADLRAWAAAVEAAHPLKRILRCERQENVVCAQERGGLNP